MTVRTSGAELPTPEDVYELARQESQRLPLRFDYLQKNAAIFDPFRELAELAGTSAEWCLGATAMSLEELHKEIMTTNQAIADFIHDNPEHEVYSRVYEALVPREDDSPTDLIFVFGSELNVRAQKAAELYKNGVADKVMMSGNRPHYRENVEPEAVRMARVAIDAGVPPEAITIEDRSITLPDNVKRSLDLLETMNLQPKSVTLVATNFVLQRAKMEWYKFTPWDIEIKTVSPPVQSARFSADGWHRDDLTVRLVLNEYAKMVIEVKMDLLRTDDRLS
jgi:hypothetical protein